MQSEQITDTHIDFVKKNYGLSYEDFVAVCEDKGEKFDEIVDDLMWKECDAIEDSEETGKISSEGKCVMELIDIMCGPYDEEEVNKGMEE